MAGKPPPRTSQGRGEWPISAESDDCDPKFLDDLVAAIRLKACLIGRGVEVDDKILDKLAEFHSRFSDEIKASIRLSEHRMQRNPRRKAFRPPPEAHQPERPA